MRIIKGCNPVNTVDSSLFNVTTVKHEIIIYKQILIDKFLSII